MIVRLLLHPYTSKIKEKAATSLNIKQNQMMRSQQEIVVKYHVEESCQK